MNRPAVAACASAIIEKPRPSALIPLTVWRSPPSARMARAAKNSAIVPTITAFGPECGRLIDRQRCPGRDRRVEREFLPNDGRLWRQRVDDRRRKRHGLNHGCQTDEQDDPVEDAAGGAARQSRFRHDRKQEAGETEENCD